MSENKMIFSRQGGDLFESKYTPPVKMLIFKDSSEKSRLYPIWGFHSAYKYYPFDHQVYCDNFT